MIDHTYFTLIKSVSLFQGLSSDQLERIVAPLSEREYREHELIIEEGEMSGGIFFIIEGSVKVYKVTKEGEEVNLAILGVGDVVGEMSLLDHAPRSANVETLQKTTL